jgi:hypothetical protein
MATLRASRSSRTSPELALDRIGFIRTAKLDFVYDPLSLAGGLKCVEFKSLRIHISFLDDAADKDLKRNEGNSCRHIATRLCRPFDCS